MQAYHDGVSSLKDHKDRCGGRDAAERTSERGDHIEDHQALDTQSQAQELGPIKLDEDSSPANGTDQGLNVVRSKRVHGNHNEGASGST
jgi:hypothetical protein